MKNELQLLGRNRFAVLLSKYWLFFFTVVIGVIFTLAQPRFASIGNLLDILSTTCVFGIVGIGVSLVMITGEIDFCCGVELSTGACLMAVLLDIKGFHSYFLALVITMAAMFLIGLLNGFLHVYIGIPGFIATMGTSLLIQGILKWLTNSASVFSTRWPACFTFLGQSRIFKIVPVSAVCLIVVALVFLVYTERTRNGKRLYAVGANAKACKYVGIDARSVKMKSFILCAMLCGFAGVINGSMLNSANPYMGDTALLSALTMLMLGATFYRIGMFNVPGTILGALLVNIINNGMTMLGAQTYQKYLVQGVVMLVAVTVVTLIRLRTAKKD